MPDQPIIPLIAVVDDDLSLRRALGRLLDSAGFEYAVFASGAQLLQSPACAGAACLLIDVHLVGLDGFETCERLRAAAGTVPVVFMTGRDSPETRSRAAGVRRSAYLKKPFDASELIDRIQSLLDRGEAPADTIA